MGSLLVAALSLAAITTHTPAARGTPASGYIIVPTCPTNLSVIEFGGICKDMGTGKILYRGELEAIP